MTSISESSMYDIDIDWSNDTVINNIDFSHHKIKTMFSGINPSKAYALWIRRYAW